MSVPHSLLALLAERPAHGYGLKAGFERRTAGAWPLNVGQVYATLGRLERDGLVERADDGEEARQVWRVTAAGRAAVDAWYEAPVVADPPARDELAIKLLLALAAEGVDAREVLQRQRTATLERLQELTREKLRADPEGDLAWVLLVDALVLKARAEVEWLDLVEERLRARGGRS